MSHAKILGSVFFVQCIFSPLIYKINDMAKSNGFIVLNFLPQIHLCYSSAKKEKTAIGCSVFFVIAIISTIFNGGFLIWMCYLRKKKNDLTEKNSLKMVMQFFTVLNLDGTNHSYFFINFIKHITSILFEKKNICFK